MATEELKRKLAALRGPRKKPAKITGKLPVKKASPLTKQLATLRKSRPKALSVPKKDINAETNARLLDLANKIDAFSKNFEHNIAVLAESGRPMPDFRKLSMGIQGQIDEIKAGGGGRPISNEVPTGTVNGTNKTFTLANTPVPVASLKVFVNGQRMKAGGEDFTLTSNSIAFVSAPPGTSILLADYDY